MSYRVRQGLKRSGAPATRSGEADPASFIATGVVRPQVAGHDRSAARKRYRRRLQTHASIWPGTMLRPVHRSSQPKLHRGRALALTKAYLLDDAPLERLRLLRLGRLRSGHDGERLAQDRDMQRRG